ncbi:MAG: galactose mutarotase, partial [Phycisphaerae bacterium]|nr:galactose mutarotase [Phycisphaerae bacterium]
LAIDVLYTLTNNDELKVEMVAETDKATPINLAHHSYWNLAGHNSGSILHHRLVLNADRYTPTDKTLIPTGEIASVAGTPFDFRHGKRIGLDIGALPGDGGDDPGGYDVNYVLNGEPGGLKLAAVVHEPNTDRVMEIHTTEPGIQFYSGNFLNGHKGKDAASYEKHEGFCLETQHFPDSINQPDWPSVVLQPGETYRHVMIHRFYVKK